jgi:hypothetical protein
MEDVGVFYFHLIHFMTIWYRYLVAIWRIYVFGIFFPVLVCCTTKNLATLGLMRTSLSLTTCSMYVHKSREIVF